MVLSGPPIDHTGDLFRPRRLLTGANLVREPRLSAAIGLLGPEHEPQVASGGEGEQVPLDHRAEAVPEHREHLPVLGLRRRWARASLGGRVDVDPQDLHVGSADGVLAPEGPAARLALEGAVLVQDEPRPPAGDAGRGLAVEEDSSDQAVPTRSASRTGGSRSNSRRTSAPVRTSRRSPTATASTAPSAERYRCSSVITAGGHAISVTIT